MNYTKRDWEVIKRTVDGEIHVSGDGYFIANCGHTGKDEVLPYNPNAEANAHLIAAAPDMYKALKTLIHGIDRDCNEFDHYFSFEKDSPLADTLRQALAKAEGK